MFLSTLSSILYHMNSDVVSVVVETHLTNLLRLCILHTMIRFLVIATLFSAGHTVKDGETARTNGQHQRKPSLCM
jgi:hypothetical protein